MQFDSRCASLVADALRRDALLLVRFYTLLASGYPRGTPDVEQLRRRRLAVGASAIWPKAPLLSRCAR
jgi:hypothetical protein